MFKKVKKEVWTEVLVSSGVITVVGLAISIAEYENLKHNISGTWYGSIIAIIFLVFGIYAGVKWMGRKSVGESGPKDISKYNLSQREIEVFDLLILGRSNQEISEVLHISLSTVKTHVSNIFIKMDVKSRAQVLALYQEL